VAKARPEGARPNKKSWVNDLLCNYSEVRPFHCQTSDIIWAKKSISDLTEVNLFDV